MAGRALGKKGEVGAPQPGLEQLKLAGLKLIATILHNNTFGRAWPRASQVSGAPWMLFKALEVPGLGKMGGASQSACPRSGNGLGSPESRLQHTVLRVGEEVGSWAPLCTAGQSAEPGPEALGVGGAWIKTRGLRRPLQSPDAGGSSQSTGKGLVLA